MCVFLYCFGSGFYIRYACYTVYITFKYLYEASDPLEKNESPIKENDVQEPLTVNGAVQKPKNKKRTGNGNTVMKVDDLFVKKSKG